MQLKNTVTQSLEIEFPIIMAPMFLVSNESMVTAAMDAGIMGCFPSLNYRNEGEFEKVLDNLNDYRAKTNSKGSYGINLIVQRTNPLYAKHLAAAVERKVPFYITSLGSPEETIKKAHTYGAKVYCDVTNLEHAQKCYDLGCDGFIAVGQGAGGHAGPYPQQLLVPTLKKHFPNTPVISAGGVANGAGISSMLALGAEGVSIGTLFIASTEGGVSQDYKQAMVDYGMEDIVMSDKISGTPCTVVNTPYAKKIGYKQNWLEKALSTNKRTKKYFKMLVQLRGMKRLESALQPATYKTLWVAGQSVEMIDAIRPCKEIVDRLKAETFETLEKLGAMAKQGQTEKVEA